MIADAELDRILVAWISEGGAERAPEPFVRAALDTVAVTRPRRPGPLARWLRTEPDQWHAGRTALVLVVIALLLAVAAIGVGTTIVEQLTPDTTVVPRPVPTVRPAVVAEPAFTPAPTQAAVPPQAEGAGSEAWFADELAGIRARIPAAWVEDPQPRIDGQPAFGVHSFGGGRLVIAIGRPNGDLTWCHPACRRESGISTFEDLTAALDGDQDAVRRLAAGDTTLGLEPARFERVEWTGRDGNIVARYRVFGFHDSRPMALAFEQSEGAIPQATIDQVVRDVALTPINDFDGPEYETHAIPGTKATITASWQWTRTSGPDETALYLTQGPVVMSVRRGDADGSIRTCDVPSWTGERCRRVQAGDIKKLAQLVLPSSPKDTVHDTDRTPRSLAMEPAELIDTSYFQPPQSESDTVRDGSTYYIVAMHNGRPWVIRMQARAWSDIARWLDPLLDGFRFGD